MLKSFLEIMRQLFGYADDTKKNTADIKTLQADREVLNIVIRQILADMDTDRQLAERDKLLLEEQRQNLILRLENVMLKSADQRALPSATPAPNLADIEARLAALEAEVAELKRRPSRQNPR